MAAWSSYMSNSQYQVLRSALAEDPEFDWSRCRVVTLQSMKRHGWLELEFGTTTTPKGRTARGVVGARITNAGRHAAATVARMRKEEITPAGRPPAKQVEDCPLLTALISSPANQLAVAIDTAFGY